MPRIALVAAASLAVGCFDFGLEERQFRCGEDPSICGEGFFCQQPENVCVPDDGRELCGNGVDDDGDDRIDCADVDCGVESCEDDGNACTTATCVSNGECQHDPEPDVNCGIGCMCEGGVETEIVCNDRIDNDGDQAIDCQDTDCAACAPSLDCCDDGVCRASC